MADIFGLIYAVIICALGGFIGQLVFNFFKPKIGWLFSGLVASVIAFFLMVTVAILSQWLFGYPVIA